MRKSLLLICVVGLSCVSWARTNRASWANLTGLQAGQKIEIVDMKSKKHFGTFVNVTDTAISYEDGAGDQPGNRVELAFWREKPVLEEPCRNQQYRRHHQPVKR